MSPISAWEPSELDKWKQRAEQAEAALAERDRMLRWCYEYMECDENRPTVDDWLADLRARAEEGSDT